MPNLEAPIGYDESSPENSYSAEAVGDVPTVGEPMQPLPAGAVEIRVQPAGQQTPLAPTRRLPALSPNPVRVRPLQRFSEFDREIAALEEENYWPVVPVVQILPINLPPQLPEPSLDELLRRVTGRNDLHNVDTVRLRVISYSISLASLPLFLPRLQHLDLSGSVLCSLRDLGYGLLHLTYLNVSNCGLNSFDGTSGLPAIRVIIADGNMIQRVDPLTDLVLLQRLSVRNNRISDLGLLTFLGLCPNLLELELQGNSVIHNPLYRTTLQRSVPTLRILDGIALGETVVAQATVIIEPAGGNSSTDGEVSSLSSELYSDSSRAESNASSLANVPAAIHRPATAPQPAASEGNVSVQSPRPVSVSHTAELRRNSLSMGAPVVGSVLSLVRRNRRQRRQAWTTSSHSSSSSSSLHSFLENESSEKRLSTLPNSLSNDDND
ncbi:nischarin [Bactrocera oleae]|uniref:nischarin n=1 Tax=Bactrocera oleae TaxID=104688 RepID=UPI00387EAEA4